MLLEWNIRYHGHTYKIQQWGISFTIEIDHPRHKYRNTRLSKDKTLRRLIEMWGGSIFAMKPGEFIRKVTGSRCDDLV